MSAYILELCFPCSINIKDKYEVMEISAKGHNGKCSFCRKNSYLHNYRVTPKKEDDNHS